MIEQVREELKSNKGKLSFPFISRLAEEGTITYLHPTQNMRLCIITLKSGHEVLGVAQVLDASNDVEEIGNNIAYSNAVNEVWKVIGAIAKAIM